MSDEVFKAGVSGNGGFEILVEILDVLFLEQTVCGPEVSQDCERSDLGEPGDLVFECSIELLQDILLNLGLYGLVHTAVLLKQSYLLDVFLLELCKNRCRHWSGWDLKRWAGVCGNDELIVAEKKESG